MSEPARARRTATILPFPHDVAPERVTAEPKKPVLMARTLEFYAILYPRQIELLMVFRSWLAAAELDGLIERQPEYVDGLKRAITALRLGENIQQAITLVRCEEAALTCEYNDGSD